MANRDIFNLRGGGNSLRKSLTSLRRQIKTEKIRMLQNFENEAHWHNYNFDSLLLNYFHDTRPSDIVAT